MFQTVSQLLRIVPFCLVYVATANAGVLTLINGDRVHGELVVVERERVVWLSENFGEVEIEKAKILSLDTDAELKISGREEPCTLAGHRRQQWELYCSQGSGWVMDFPAIEHAEPYNNFVANPIVYHGRATAGGVLEQGNQEREDWDLNVKFDVRQGDFRHLLDALSQRKTSTEEDTEGNSLGRYQLNYDLRWIFAEKWFAAGNSGLKRDEARNLSLGTAFGLGLGYLFYDTDKTEFSLEGGLSQVNDHFIDQEKSDEQDKRYTAGRITADYRYKFSLGPEIYFNPELLQSLNSADDLESSFKVGVNTPLVKNIVLDVNYLWEYDRTPSLDSKKEDTKLTIGVGYEW